MHVVSQRPRAWALAIVAVLVATAVISATERGQALETGDLRASTSTVGSQDSVAIARDADGDFIVVWAGNGTEVLQTDTAGVFFQRYNRNGVAQGSETRVNTTTTGIQRNPAIAADASGNFVVVWETCDAGGAACDVALQRYNASGAPQGVETVVNTTTANEQTRPAIGMAAGGAFVVAWQCLSQAGPPVTCDGSGQGIYAQRFNNLAQPQGAELQVNTTTAFSQIDPGVAVDIDGDFIVAWSSGDGSGQGVFAQAYAANGTAAGSEFRVNADTTGNQITPAVAMSADGAFVVAWEGPDASGTGILMRRYDSSRAALGSDQAVNTTTAGNQSAPALAVDASGDIVVAWSGPDADPFGVFFQRFNAAGTAQGAETAANFTTAGDQAFPAVAADADGDFAIAWQSFAQDGDNYGIYLRRFSGPEDVDLRVTKTDSADPVTNGAPYNYTVTVQNLQSPFSGSGNATVDAAVRTATGVRIVDTLPTGVGFVQGTGTDWSCTNAGGTVTCNYSNVLAPGGSTSVTLSVTASATGGEMINTVTVSANQYDSVQANNTDTEDTFACASANPGTLAFSAATYTVGEDGDDAGGNDDGLATITVTRSGGSCGRVTVQAGSSNGTAVAGEDYTAVPAGTTLTWQDGDATSKTFTVAITNDVKDEVDTETVNLALSNPTRATLGSQSTATLNITDNDAAPGVAMSLTGSPFSENGGTATVTATLDAVSGRSVTVNLAFAGTANRAASCGTAQNPADYSCSATSISIPAGSTSGSMTLTGTDDARDEPDLETVQVTATCPTPMGQSHALCTPTAAAPQVTAEVQDDDAVPVVQFSVASSSASEAQDPTNPPSLNRTATLTVQLSAVSDRAATVDFTSAGTAIKGTDYTLAPDSPGTLTIAAGQTSATLTVTILHDTLDEANETVVVTLANPGNASLGANNPHTFTILDDDGTPTVSFNPNTASVTEGDSGTQQVTATAELSAASALDVTVPFTVSGSAKEPGDATAADPADHNAVDGSIVIPAGQTSGSYSFNVLGDLRDEANETVVLTMGTPTNATVGANGTHTTTINDNDPLPTVQIDAGNSTSSRSEAGGTATIVVTLSPVSGRQVTAPYTLSGTATSGSDYTISPASPLTFGIGETSKTLTVTLINDPNQEPNETLVFTLNAPTNADLGTPTSHTLTIVDDDAVPQVHFTAASQTRSEAVGTTAATLQLSRATTSDVTVPFTTGGSASGNDYTLECPDGLGGRQPCAGEVIIPAGQTTGDITINVVNDRRVEPDETLTLTIGTPLNATRDEPSVHTLTITDDDTAGVTLEQSFGSTDVAEGGATDTYTLVLNSQPSSDVTVDLDIVGADVDASPLVVTFTAANWDTAQTITVSAVDDAFAEGAHSDTITHTVSSLDMDYDGFAVPDVTVNITDNDVPAVVVTESDGGTAATEGGATDSYTLVLTTQPVADVTITLMSSQVVPSATSVTFTPGNWNVAQTITVTADDDPVAEGDHSGVIMHTAASADVDYNSADGLVIRDVTVAITDNDAAGVIVTQSGGATSVTEGGATDTYTIVLTSQPTADVTITLTGDADVGGSPASVTFDATNWNLARTITVTAVDDSFAEGTHNGTITHNAASADPNYDGIAVAGVTATITDNETAGVIVTQSGGSTNVTEGGATDTYTLVLTSQPTADVTITVAGDADVGGSPASVTFTGANWNVAQTVTVTAVDDSFAEGTHNGTITHTLSSTDPGYNGVAVAGVTATITDNDSVVAGEGAPGVVVTPSGNVASGSGDGGALGWSGLLALLGLAGVRRRGRVALAAMLALAAGSVSAQGSSAPSSAAMPAYRTLDLRYLTVKVDDPAVDAEGFTLAGSWAASREIFLTGAYASVETDRLRIGGVVGASRTETLGLGLGWHRAVRPGMDLAASVSVLSADAEGQGGFTGSSSDTGFGIDAGLRARHSASLEWGIGLSHVSIFGDTDTGLSGQVFHYLGRNLGVIAGAGFGSNSSQFNVGVRCTY